MDREEQIERIVSMEARLDAAASAIEGLDAALGRYVAAREQIEELSSWYGSDAWRKDFDDDAAGELPVDLKRGVLSEDAVYDLLTAERELLARMMEIARGALEGK